MERESQARLAKWLDNSPEWLRRAFFHDPSVHRYFTECALSEVKEEDLYAGLAFLFMTQRDEWKRGYEKLVEEGRKTIPSTDSPFDLLGPSYRTERGFEYLEFSDRFNEKCLLQESSLAELTTPGTSAVWLGQKGGHRMLLNRKMVESLIWHLRNWLENDTFQKEEPPPYEP